MELRGVPYGDWHIVRATPLSDDERVLLFQAEAVAEGNSAQNAAVLAKQAADRLKARPALLAAAATPLVARPRVLAAINPLEMTRRLVISS